ncbi:hypothetical protein JCM8547_003088 [Rhodosporidiobolus lusitaniae]
MSSQAVATSAPPSLDSRREVLSLALSLGPLWFLVNSRASLGLDRLHLGMLQVLMLIVLRWALDLVPSRTKPEASKRSSSPPPPLLNVDKGPVSQPVTTPTTASASKKRRTRHDAAAEGKKQRRSSPSSSVHPPLDAPLPQKKPSSLRPSLPAPPPAVPPPLPLAKLDDTVANFLAITEPAFLAYLPVKPTTSIPPAALSSWTSTYSAGEIEVLQHPTLKSLFGICSTYPEVPLRALYEVLTDIEKRAEWDSMTQGAEEIVRWENEGKRANIMHMRMKGMPMVKAKDLVLLSVPGTLPTASNSTSSTSADPSKPLSPETRIFAATTSVLLASHPPTPDFNRMELAVSGFMIEEANEGRGSRIVQITDLSGLGSWIPSAVIRTVTQTMLPKSLIKLGAAAAQAALSPNLSVDYPPPVLGSPPPPPSSTPLDSLPAPASSSHRTASVLSSTLSDPEEEEEDADSPFSSVSSDAPLGDSGKHPPLLRPSASRDLHALLTQLRGLTTRLTALESLVSINSQAQATARGRPWWAFGFGGGGGGGGEGEGGRRGPTAGARTKQLSDEVSAGRGSGGRGGMGSGLSAVLTVGSAAAAAVAVAAVAAWGRRAQR